jgi:hypothetical protein
VRHDAVCVEGDGAFVCLPSFYRPRQDSKQERGSSVVQYVHW